MKRGRQSAFHGAGKLVTAGELRARKRLAVDTVMPLVTVVFPEDVRYSTERKLVWAGLAEKFDAGEFLAFKLMACGALPVGGMLFGGLLGLDPAWFLLLGGVGYILPDVWLNSRVSARQKAIKKELPVLGTFLATAVATGVGLRESFRHAGRWLGGVLGSEIEVVELEVNSGRSWHEAMQRMADRCGVEEVTQMVQLITQAERYGTPVEDVVLQFTAQIKVMHRYHMEKLAGEMSVKLVFPIFVFIAVPIMVLICYPMWQQLKGLLGTGGW